MSFKGYMKKGKDNVVEKKRGPNTKPIKDPETIELPKIDQGPKERVDLLGLLKNMKWEEHKLNKVELPSTDEPEIIEPAIVTKQIISHDLVGKKNHTAFVKAQLLKNHVSKRNIPETKPSVEKPKVNTPKVQINRPVPPQSPSEKPRSNAAIAKAQLQFSNRNPKNPSSLSISKKNANTKINESKNQELIDTQNEIAKVQAQLEFLKNNPDYIPETDVSDEKPKKSELKPALQSENQELIDTQNEIAKVQAQLEFLKNNPDYLPETDVSYEKPKKSELVPALQSGNQVLIDTQNEIAKVQAELEFLKNNPDYIPETNECIPKNNELSSSKVPAKQTNIRTKQPDTQKIAEAKNKVTEAKSQLEILEINQEESFEDYRKRMQKCNRKKKPGTLDTIVEEESEVFQDGFEEQEDVTETEEILEEEVNEEKLEEECETLGEEADTECEEADGEQCEEADGEQCEEADEEEWEETDEECEETDAEEADEETQDVNEEERENNENTEFHTAKNNNSQKFDTYIPAQQKRQLLDLLKKISWGKPEKSNESVKLEEVQSAENSDSDEESATECVEVEETQLAESNDNEEVLESSEIESDSLEKRDIKFDDLEIPPFGTKKADSVAPKTCNKDIITSFFKSTPVPKSKSVSPKDSKEDIFTSFFKNEPSQEEILSASETSSLKMRKFQEELLESSSVATPKTEEVHTKSISENEPEKSQASENGSFSSFFEEKPLIKPKQKMQCKPTEPVSDQSKSLSETKTTPKDLQPQPKAVESKLEQRNGDEISSKGLKQLPSLTKCDLEQDERDEIIPENFKRESSPIKCNVETDKKDEKTMELSTHKIINVAPCERSSKIVSRCMDFELDSSEKPTKPNSQYTEIRDFSSDSCTENEESLKIESVHTSEDNSKGSKQSFICHLYKVKIRIKSVSWRGSGNMKAVTLSFYNPFTKENASVKRKFVLPYFYTADFYCYVPYISPPNMLDSSLAYYPPVIFISKRRSLARLARGVLNLNKEELQEKSNSFYSNVPLTSNGKIIGDAMVSVKILDYGPLGDRDDSSNEIIEIVFNETKNKSIKIARLPDFVDKAVQKKKKRLIAEEFSSLGDNTSSDLSPNQLFKKRPFRYKRETKSKRTEWSRRYKSEGSLLVASSISIPTDEIKKRKSFINNCKDIQTDIQEEDVLRTKSKSKMIQTETEMDSKYTTTTLQCESKVTQTEATSEHQTVSTPKNKQPKKYKKVETMKEFPPITTTPEKKQQITSSRKNKMTKEKPTQSSSSDESEEIWKPKRVSSEPLKYRKLTQVRDEEIFPELEEIKSIRSKRVRSKNSKPLKSKEDVEKVQIEKIPNFKQIYPALEKTESIKLKQNKSPQPRKSKIVKLKAAPKQLDLRIDYQKSTDYKTEAFDLTEECTAEETLEAVYKYLEGKKLAERFFKVCTERKPALFNNMTYEEQKLYKCNYVKRLRDALPSDFVTPPSIKTKENYSSERRWISHMAAFLHKEKAMSSDGSSSSVDKTDDQVSEIRSEIAAPDVLINNPDYHAMNKYYHPELCKADVMTSTSYPHVKPPTTECGAQTSERVIKIFTAQTTQERLLPLLSKKPKKLSGKTSELQACLVIVDTIPPARNGGEKFINKNVLYEKVRESERPQNGNTRNVKKSSKTIKLSKNNIKLESYPEQCSSAMPNKNIVKNLKFELQDFVKNIKLEVHVLKHRLQYTPDVHHRKKNSRESTDFDRLVNSFTSLVGRNEESDFNAVYSELQQLQDLVYNTFKKFSEEQLEKTEFRSKAKQIKHIDNYVSQDNEMKLIFKNPKMDQAPKRRSHDKKSFKAQSLPNIKSISTLPSEADISDFESAVPFYTKFKNRFFKVPSKNKQELNSRDSESTLTPLGEKSKNAVSMLSLRTGEPIEIEKSQMEAIKDKMTTVQIKLRCYLHERQVLSSKNNEHNPTVTQISKNIMILLHEWRRLKAYVEQLYQL